MTRPTNHIAGHVEHMHAHMSESQRRASEIRQLAADYLAANPPATGPAPDPAISERSTSSPPQPTA